MQRTISSIIILLPIYLAATFVARADVVEVVGSLQSGRFSEGVNLTGNQLGVDLTAGWSGDNGTFASLSCFAAENVSKPSIKRGCDATLGWFTPIKDDHAITAAISHHDYSSPILSGWQYSDLSVSWHIGRANMLKVRATNSLLGQDFAAIITSFHASRPLSDQWRLKFEAGLTSLQDSPSISRLEYGLVSVEYVRARWAAELKLMLSSSDYRRFVKLDIDQPDASFNLRYRFY